jgi:hypothetical protein
METKKAKGVRCLVYAKNTARAGIDISDVTTAKKSSMKGSVVMLLTQGVKQHTGTTHLLRLTKYLWYAIAVIVQKKNYFSVWIAGKYTYLKT